MADAPAPSASKGFDLTRKIGPLPLWAWLGAAAAIWWYLQRQQAAKAAAPNQQTDPAGNIGAIDQATGYVYGTPEDTAALAANNAGTSSSGTSAGTNATTGAQKYADNNTWGIAAVNYLVGLGIDGTTANQAVQNYLSSQPLTTSEQGDVNLAIQALGAPPSLPGPVSPSPPPVTTPGGGSSAPVYVAVPDGSGHWMNAEFPSQGAENTFYANIGVRNGDYPNGLSNAQITSAVQQVGGQIISGTGLVL
jgi:hypothetical protein